MGCARCLWHSANIRSSTTTKSFSLAQNNLDWSSRRGEMYLKNDFKKFELPVLSYIFWDIFWSIFFSYNFCQVWWWGGGGGVNSGLKAAGWRTVNQRLTREIESLFCCRSWGWFKKESSQVFTFDMIGASCATLHSNQETLWHFNSQGVSENPRQ